MQKYVAVSNKPWHRRSFNEIDKSEPGNWAYVQSLLELEKVIEKVTPRYIFFLHWSSKLPSYIFLNYECVCFHMSDLPYGRGGSPLQNLIADGHQETILSALKMVEELDAGPIYTKRPLELTGRAEDIYLRAGELSWEIIKWIVKEEPMPIPQKGEVSIFKRRKPSQSAFPKSGGLRKAYDHVRMLDAPSYPKAFIAHGDYQVEFHHARLESEQIVAQVVIKLSRSDSNDKE